MLGVGVAVWFEWAWLCGSRRGCVVGVGVAVCLE